MEAFNYRDNSHRFADRFFLDSLVQIRMVSLAFSKLCLKRKMHRILSGLYLPGLLPAQWPLFFL